MQPRYRSFLPLISAAGLVFSLSCGGGAGVQNGSSLRRGDVPPTTYITGYTPSDPTLVRFQPYTFTATATDPDIGDSITQFEWDIQEGTGGPLVVPGQATQTPTVITTTGQLTHIFTGSGLATVRVRAYDTSFLAGDYASINVPVDKSSSPITAAFLSPSGAVSVQADPSGGVYVTFSIKVTSTSTGTIGLSNLNFNTGDSNSSVTNSQAAGGGVFNYTVRYNGGSPSAPPRTATPTVQVTDSLGISSDLVSGPTITINTLATTNHAPVIVITDPATLTSAGFTTKPVNLGFTITDQDKDLVAYSVNWGDGTPPTMASTTGDTSMGVAIALTHVYPDSFTSGSANAVIRIDASDGRTNNGQAAPQTRTFTISFNAFPTASITSPQASATLPSPTDLPSNPGIGLMNPPGPNDPDFVVIPSGGKVSFAGISTPPGSGEPVTTYLWTFHGGVPASSTDANPGEVIFTANPGTITPLLAELKVADTFGRLSSDAQGVNPKTFRKWIIVDGTNTQAFKLNFLYRQKADNNGIASVTPATSVGNGLGAPVNIFQDGLTNTYLVQNQAGQAVASIPVRSNLPFFVLIPNFGDDARGYLLRIPNAPTGPYRDPTLGAVLAPNASTFGFENSNAPFNPTLKIVTGQGFAPENQEPQHRHIVGTTPVVYGNTTPSNTRWIDRLSVPLTPSDSLGALNEWVQSNNSIYGFDLVANQSFAEWLIVLKSQGTVALAEVPTPDPTSTEGKPDTLGFILNYSKYTGDTQASETFAASAMQAFRVPGGVTDPYDITLAGSNAPNFTVFNLNPQKVGGTIPSFFNHSIFAAPGATALSGGIQNLAVPYDANDPDRKPYQSLLYPFANTRAVFSYSEFLWSTAWARPLVLNQASLNFGDTVFALGSFPFFRRCNPAVWPKSTTGITPDGSQFDLTVSEGGTFDASSPVSVGGTPGTKGVGRFFWTAYTPFYAGGNGSVISRTWLSDPTGQPPTTFAATTLDATPAATSALGFVPPQDVVIDKRGRNADGSLNGNPSGGYRVTWFNPTKDVSGNPVPPDFWVVELQTASANPRHFMLPGNFPADAQSTSDLILTDARTFLPSGRTNSQGPSSDALHPDLVGPGYCWFDIPVELRPVQPPPPGAPVSATVIVFAAKSILKNNPPPGSRVLNRPDWLDAIKTASATINVVPLTGDISYAHKIPFNFFWDIVVANSPKVVVAP